MIFSRKWSFVEKVKMLQPLLNVEQFDRVNNSVATWLKDKSPPNQLDNIAALTLLLKVLYNPLVVVEFGNQKLIENRQQEIYDKLHNLSSAKAEELLKQLSPKSK